MDFSFGTRLFVFKLSQLLACSKLAVARQLGDLAREAERQLVAVFHRIVIFFLYLEPPRRLTTRRFSLSRVRLYIEL